MLKSDWKKYIVLFSLLVLTVGFVAGMFVANDSMETAAINAYEKYNIEHGHFELQEIPTEKLLAYYEGEGIRISKQYYKDFDEDCNLDGTKDALVRIFVVREDMNRACLMSGRMPEQKDEIVIDRMHADNQKIKIGDEITLDGVKVKVTGLIASSDYSTLYEKPTDMMFNAITFDVGFMTKEGYDSLKAKEIYQYAYQFEKAPADEEEQKEMSDDLVKKLAVLAATGGYTDDEDTAKTLEKDIKTWTEYLEEVQEKADRAKILQSELEKAEEELKEQAADQQKVMEILTKAGYSMEQIMTMSEAQIGEIVQKALITDEMQAKIDELTSLAEELEQEEDTINDYADHLKELEPFEDDMNELTSFLPEYANQAIHFAPNDMGSDKAMGEVLLIMLVGILAFIFAVTVNNTIVNDSAVIGTLRASGYTKGELLKHYTALPITVSLIAALVGNILGYTLLKNVVVAMYYNSYSLPTYETLWNADAFVKTTIIPVVLVVAIILFVVSCKLQFSPLKFLRHDLSSSRRKKAVRLPQISFLGRFRLRIFLHSIGDYVMLLIGITFVTLLMYFAVGLPATLNHYSESFAGMLLSQYQYILKDYKDADGNVIETGTEGAEKFGATSLNTIDGVHVGEEISVYGCKENSIYLPDLTALRSAAQDQNAGKDADAVVAVSVSYSDKFGLKVGDTVTLKQKFGSDTYRFYIGEIVDYEAALAVFLPINEFNRVLELDEDSFGGYLSDQEITDIDEKYIVKTITVDDYMKIVKQLDHSMGDYMDYFAVICVGVAALLLYLLTKLIVEKNALSISMVKVLGYTNKEINSIYVLLTSIVVAVSAVISIWIAKAGLEAMWKSILSRLNGWFGLYMSAEATLKVLALILIAYLIVAMLDMRRIKRVPLTEALKNVE